MAFNKVGIKDSLDIAFATANQLQNSEQQFHNMQLQKQQRDMLVAEKQKQNDMEQYASLMSYVTNRDNIINHYNEGTENQLVDYLNRANGIAGKYGLPSTYSMKSIVYNTYMKDFQDARSKYMPLYNQNNIAGGDLIQQDFIKRWGNGKFDWLFNDIRDQEQLKFEANKQQQMATAQGQINSFNTNRNSYYNDLDAINNDDYSQNETLNQIRSKVNDKNAMLQASGMQEKEINALWEKYNSGKMTKEEQDAFYNKYGLAFGGAVNGYDLTGVATKDALSKYINDDKQRRIKELNAKYGFGNLTQVQISEQIDNNLKTLQDNLSQISSLVPDTTLTGVQILMRNEKDAGLKIGATNWELSNNIYKSFYNEAPAEFFTATPEQRKEMLPQILSMVNAPDSVKDNINIDNLINFKGLPKESYQVLSYMDDMRKRDIQLNMAQAEYTMSAYSEFAKQVNNMMLNYNTPPQDIATYVDVMKQVVQDAYITDTPTLNAFADTCIQNLNRVLVNKIDEKQKQDVIDELKNVQAGLDIDYTKAKIDNQKIQNYFLPIEARVDIDYKKAQTNNEIAKTHATLNGNNNNGKQANGEEIIISGNAYNLVKKGNDTYITKKGGGKLDIGKLIKANPNLSNYKKDIVNVLNNSNYGYNKLMDCVDEDGEIDMKQLSHYVIMARNGNLALYDKNGIINNSFYDEQKQAIKQARKQGKSEDEIIAELKKFTDDPFEFEVLKEKLGLTSGNKKIN